MHEVLRPIIVHSKSSINVTELVSMSNLSWGESIGDVEPSSHSLKLLEDPSSRQSTFHANQAWVVLSMNSSSNMNILIHHINISSDILAILEKIYVKDIKTYIRIFKTS